MIKLVFILIAFAFNFSKKKKILPNVYAPALPLPPPSPNLYSFSNIWLMNLNGQRDILKEIDVKIRQMFKIILLCY